MKTCKGYVNLLAELGLPAAAPEVPSVEIVPGQLVDLAAKIAPTLPGAGIGEVVAAAAALWQSSARLATVEPRLEMLAKGIFCFSLHDWEMHCRCLVACYDDLAGGVPGLRKWADRRESYARAQWRASTAMSEWWEGGLGFERGLAGLFPSARAGGAGRRRDLGRLLKGYWAGLVGAGAGHAQMGPEVLVGGMLRSLWWPLLVEDGSFMAAALAQAMAMARNGDGAAVANGEVLHPMVARWLGVMRQAAVSRSHRRG